MEQNRIKICGRLKVFLTLAAAACLLILFLHSFAVFHARVGLEDSRAFSAQSNNISATSASARILYAVREDRRRAARKFSEPEQRPVLPPQNASQEERTRWFRENRSRFAILQADGLSARFAARAGAFLGPCELRFFMTWISSAREFGRRELLALESLFKAHPEACALIMSRSLDSAAGAAVLRPFAASGFRVLAAAPDLRYLLAGTAAEPWLRAAEAGDLDPGEIPFAQNLSNILRLAALYKFGGVYIDTDVVVLRSFAALRNAIGAQNRDPRTGRWNRLNNAVLVFDRGHPLLAGFIREFALTFDGNKWGHNGPYLVTRVLSRLLKSAGNPNPSPNPNREDRCAVLPPVAFYPVDWTRISSFFRAPPAGDQASQKWRAAKIAQVENESYAIHLWNKQSRYLKVEPGSIIHHFFARRCIFCHLHLHLRPGPVL